MENFCSLVSDWWGEVEWSDHGTPLTLVTTGDSALWPVDRDLSPHQSFSGKEDWGGEPTDYLPDLTWSTNNFLSQHNSLLSNIFHVSSVVCQCHHHHDRDQLLPLHHDPHQQLFQYDPSQVFPAPPARLCCAVVFQQPRKQNLDHEWRPEFLPQHRELSESGKKIIQL